MKNKTYLLLLFCLLFSQINGRNIIKDSLPSKSEDSHTYLFTLNYGFMMSTIGKTTSNQGLVMNLGINLSHFFSNKILFGIAGDLKLSGGYFIKHGDEQYLNDLNANYNTQFDTALDSANSVIVKNALTKSTSNPITGSRLFNIGIMFSPFPNKYGGIMFQVRRGSKIFKIDVGNNPFVGGDNAYLEVLKNWIYEITFKPWTFKNDKFPSTKRFNTSITVSFHYERVNFGSAELNGTSINKMFSSEFIEKYEFDHRFGFKIGIGFY